MAEILRQKNQPTTFVFPLVSSGSNNYYTTSAWNDLTNKSISAYSWADTVAPTILSLSQTPSQISATGLWSLSATADEMNPGSGAHDYIAIKLKANEIQEQTLLVILTSYSFQNLADTTNKVNANQVSVSAYTNFPQVYVSANGDKTGYSGIVTNQVSVSAYTNFPKVTVSANEDKINYTVSAGTINTVTNPITVSAYQNFPQVTVSANLDKTNYSISANSDKTGYALSTGSEDSVVDKVWDEMNGGHVISGSTGYNVSLLPNINDNVGTVAEGVPNNFIATSGEMTIGGTVLANSYSATWNDDGTYWQIQTTGTNALDVWITYELGTSRASQVTINGRFDAIINRHVNVFAYNYTTSAYDQLSDPITRIINNAADKNYTYNLLSDQRSSTGQVKT